MKRPSGFTPQRPANPPADPRADRSADAVGRDGATGHSDRARNANRPGNGGRVEDPQRSAADPIPLFTVDEEKESRAGSASTPTDAGSTTLRQARKLRKRLERAEVKRFTAGSRRLRRNWLIGIGSIVGLALAAVLAAYTPLLSVREIQVEGAFLVNSDAVVDDLSSQLGSPFPLVDDTAIKAALVTYPLIESYSVQARPPSTLVVRLVERTPVGVLPNADGFSVVDAAGVVIADSATRPPNYPLIAVGGGSDTDAFTAAAATLRSLPAEFLATVDEVTATTKDDVTLTLRDSESTVVWGSADESKLKAYTLTKLMASQPGFDVYDVSSPSVAVVR
ncbi:FtsQ-type POTRA domain-containing protein [Mycetocola zhujimingii]|uniref:Cell division protein FtsQ n=1 Tax=Mycetocola zhujimingii TaxID=2079792 RepID=A0A2U1TG36_9MICO|nr:FtsQ-type POTRA domain-containing protein [Mycetocola zhujimingii]AWB86292.1 cell division protein FtsQ [Mycetocola zhujimingii]PWC07844.1 cell division protein FtsQ [Mycetocola zhujimingii]